MQKIQNQVDTILFEDGIFSPILWLIREGHLDYADYLNWRNVGAGFLEDQFKTELTEIIASLKLAQHYAEKLNLDSFYQPYTSVDRQALSICRSPANELMFITAYQPAEDRVQLDLFFDSAPMLAEQDLIKAIADNQDGDIPVLLEQLRELAPEKHPPFEQLLAQRKELHRNPDSKSKIEFILNAMTPLAFKVLGRYANDFLTPFWQQLSLEISGRSFAAESPEDHSSFTAFKAFQWQDVITFIEREEDWSSQPILLYRYAEACFKLNKEEEGLESWFRLFILFPDSAKRLLGGTGNFLLLSDWRHFNELDPELDPVFFPAWTVLKKPALGKIAAKLDGESIGHNSLQLIRSLAACADEGINEAAISLRTMLRQQNPDLFFHYMAMHR